MDFTQYGPTAASVAIVLLFLNYMRDESKKRDGAYHAVAKALDKLTSATNKTTEASKANTQATKAADAYLRHRNGIDRESHKETLAAIINVPQTMENIASKQAAALAAIHKQNVKEQRVEHQTIKDKH